MSNLEEHRVIVTFKSMTRKDENESKTAGRPIYKDTEVCEMRFAADRLRVSIFPAHSFAGFRPAGQGTQEPITYAEKYNAQYLRFKQGKQQVQEGTPLSELPFLTEAKRLELRALNIYTAETLASLDGQPLKTLGPGGRELKNQAQAYLDNAAGSADVTKQAAEIAALKEQVAFLQAEKREPDGAGRKPSTDDLKAIIKARTGAAPRGNPSIETLQRMVAELEPVKEVA
jgi:hypothetical protein